MKNKGRILLLAAVALLVIGSVAAVPREVQAADRATAVMGVVDRVQGTVVTIRRATYDLKGIPLLDARLGTPVDVSTVQGKTVEIVFRNRKIVSGTVYRTLPQ